MKTRLSLVISSANESFIGSPGCGRYRCGDYRQHGWFGPPTFDRSSWWKISSEHLRYLREAAFAANFGICTITCAELRAALHGFHIAWDLGYRRVNLQVDYALVVSFLCHNGAVDPRHQTCVDKLKQLIARDWMNPVSHTYREGNRVSDLLDHHDHSLLFGMHPISTFYPEAIDCIKTNMIGISFPRSIPLNS
ncbi:Putative ribonuclease H protein At1g65750 [Linum grandiflorum]